MTWKKWLIWGIDERDFEPFISKYKRIKKINFRSVCLEVLSLGCKNQVEIIKNWMGRRFKRCIPPAFSYEKKLQVQGVRDYIRYLKEVMVEQLI